jgi:hypothetical protein
MRIKKNPLISHHQFSLELLIAEGSSLNTMKKDLGMKLRAVVKSHLIAQILPEKSLEKCRNHVNMINKKNLIFLISDKKVFDINLVSNSHLNRPDQIFRASKRWRRSALST